MSAESLGTRSISAVFWGAGGAVVRLILQVATQIALARILGPAQYGLFAVGATVISFSSFLSDIGLAYGLIQKDTVHERDIRFVMTWQVLLGSAVCAAVALISTPLAIFFGDLRAAPVIQALSAVCLLNALAAPALNLLKRSLDFKKIQLIQLVSYFLGYMLVGLPLALYGAEVWALVTAWIVQAAASGMLLYRSSRHSLLPLLWYEGARRQSGYGVTVLVTNLVNWLIGNVDRIVVARAFGIRDVGLYATSYNLFYNPTSTLLGVIQPVFFSASSRIADESHRIVDAYLSLVAALALVALPVFVAVATIAGTFVLALYGPGWSDASVLVRPLALAMPLFLLFGLTTPVLWTTGRASSEFRIQAPLAVLWIAATAIAAKFSIVHVAWTVLALYAFRNVVIIVVASRGLNLTATKMWRSIRGGLLLSLGIALALTGIDQSLQSLAAWQRLVIEICIGSVIWIVAVRFVPRIFSPELAGLLPKIVNHMPPRFSRHFAFLNAK